MIIRYFFLIFDYMKKYIWKFAVIGILTLTASFISFGQDNSVSSNPSPFCVGLTYVANTGTVAEVGNNYDCLFSQPNPSWFFLKALTSGDITLSLTALSDIDFIVYGPFDDLNELISLSGQHGVNPESPVVDCSYSGTNSETVEIPGMLTGQYYLILVTNYSSVVQDITLVQTGGTGSLDCAVLDEPYLQVSGSVFYDINQNGFQEAGESNLPNIPILFQPMNTTLFTNSSGFFNYTYFTDDTVNFEISTNLPDWSPTGSSPILFSLDTTNNDTTGIMIGLYPDSLYYFAHIDYVSAPASCASNNESWLTIYNTGTLMQNGVVEFIMDDELTFLSSTYMVDSIVGESVFFAYDSLLPFQSLVIPILAVPEPTLTAGDTAITITVLTILDSLNLVNAILADTNHAPVVCSYDPNNKISYPNGNFQLTNIIQPDDKLEYVINFQNTGNAPAVNIEIRDDLSTLLDESSFEFMSASHAVDVSIDSNRIISFYFHNINLPDSLTNEPLSHGYVKFRIGMVSTVLPNDLIENQAQIYFDNNTPISTNTTVNVIECFILPPSINLTYSSLQIQTNITDPFITFDWVLNGDTLVGEHNNFIPVTDDGEYTVIAYNQYGCYSTASYTFTQASMQANAQLEASIYPNPSTEKFTIYLKEKGNYSIQISDESGRILHCIQIQDSDKYVIDGSEMEPGIYFVQLKSESNAVATYRLMKL